MKTRTLLPFVLALALAGLVGHANAQQRLVAADSEIVFANKEMGVPVSGRFKRFDATLDFQPQHPEAGKIAITVDLASVSLGTAESEAMLARPDWFDSKSFPKASFESASVKAIDAKRFEARGKLTLKGTSRDLVVPFELSPQGGYTAATGSFTLRRKDYRIGAGEWEDVSLVADEVAVRFRFVLQGLAR